MFHAIFAVIRPIFDPALYCNKCAFVNLQRHVRQVLPADNVMKRCHFLPCVAFFNTPACSKPKLATAAPDGVNFNSGSLLHFQSETNVWENCIIFFPFYLSASRKYLYNHPIIDNIDQTLYSNNITNAIKIICIPCFFVLYFII